MPRGAGRDRGRLNSMEVSTMLTDADKKWLQELNMSEEEVQRIWSGKGETYGEVARKKAVKQALADAGKKVAIDLAKHALGKLR
jgi:hypothetical protein